MEIGNAKSSACETSVEGRTTGAGAESARAAHAVDRHVEMIAVSRLTPCKSNARTHSKQQIEQITRSIERFGFIGAVLIDNANRIIAGHGRVEAAKRLGLDQVPVLRVTHLSDAERRAYALVDNRLTELSRWDDEILAIELQELGEIDFDLADIGLGLADVDIVGRKAENTGAQTAARKTDRGASSSGRVVSRAGDLWRLGGHELRCAADAGDSYAAIDATIQRWQRVTGEPAILSGSGKSFADVAKERTRTAAKARAPRQAAGKREAA
jgi:ParB-like chromosome segregation protein Spo0J